MWHFRNRHFPKGTAKITGGTAKNAGTYRQIRGEPPNSLGTAKPKHQLFGEAPNQGNAFTLATWTSVVKFGVVVIGLSCQAGIAKFDA